MPYNIKVDPTLTVCRDVHWIHVIRGNGGGAVVGCCVRGNETCGYLLLYPTNTYFYIKVYITTACLCNLYSYMFRHFHVIIREFTTNSLLSYIRFLIAAVENTVSKIKMFDLRLT